MTHYWWMHWFWITLCIVLTYSMPLSPLSTIGSQLETEQPLNETVTEPTDSDNTTMIVTQSRELISRQDIGDGGGSVWNAVFITAVSLAVLVCAAIIAASSFVLYRRRYLNKPQTLNDKCSNPDSSGYIDDSTIRENSEEMYSLDNDSFLNSLEAMTIQNYWTDSVKHTKL